jgi:hypothetical protein
LAAAAAFAAAAFASAPISTAGDFVNTITSMTIMTTATIQPTIIFVFFLQKRLSRVLRLV